ncbi:conserved hypothetical protein [Gammaproteobacteria bacterium]
MSNYALILHPADPLVSVEIAELGAALQALGLMGASFVERDTASVTSVCPNLSDWHTVGPQLLEQVTFLGCSPVVRLAAAHDGDTGFCRLRLPPPLPHPVWYAPMDAAPPRCPRCRTSDVTWRMALPDWEANPAAHRRSCPNCGYAAPLHQWRLRETAGFGRSFVELWGIHPGEAVPGETLLATLAQLSNGPWRWFYWSAPHQ